MIEEQAGPITLVLSARSPVEWTLRGPGVDNIERLVMLGLRDHRLAAEGLQVDAESPRPNAFIHDETLFLRPLHWWPAADAECNPSANRLPTAEALENQRVCEARRIQGALRDFLGAPIDLFSGTTVASEFVIHSTLPVEAE